MIDPDDYDKIKNIIQCTLYEVRLKETIKENQERQKTVDNVIAFVAGVFVGMVLGVMLGALIFP